MNDINPIRTGYNQPVNRSLSARELEVPIHIVKPALYPCNDSNPHTDGLRGRIQVIDNPLFIAGFVDFLVANINPAYSHQIRVISALRSEGNPSSLLDLREQFLQILQTLPFLELDRLKQLSEESAAFACLVESWPDSPIRLPRGKINPKSFEKVFHLAESYKLLLHRGLHSILFNNSKLLQIVCEDLVSIGQTDKAREILKRVYSGCLESKLEEETALVIIIEALLKNEEIDIAIEIANTLSHKYRKKNVFIKIFEALIRRCEVHKAEEVVSGVLSDEERESLYLKQVVMAFIKRGKFDEANEAVGTIPNVLICQEMLMEIAQQYVKNHEIDEAAGIVRILDAEINSFSQRLAKSNLKIVVPFDIVFHLRPRILSMWLVDHAEELIRFGRVDEARAVISIIPRNDIKFNFLQKLEKSNILAMVRNNEIDEAIQLACDRKEDGSQILKSDALFIIVLELLKEGKMDRVEEVINIIPNKELKEIGLRHFVDVYIKYDIPAMVRNNEIDEAIQLVCNRREVGTQTFKSEALLAIVLELLKEEKTNRAAEVANIIPNEEFKDIGLRNIVDAYIECEEFDKAQETACIMFYKEEALKDVENAHLRWRIRSLFRKFGQQPSLHILFEGYL